MHSNLSQTADSTMKFDIDIYKSILSAADSLNLNKRLDARRSLSLRDKYHAINVRNAYVDFASSVVMKEAYSYVYKKLKDLSGRDGTLTILDLGIGEGMMWQKVFAYPSKFRSTKLNIIGVDFSKTALKRLKENLSAPRFCNIHPINTNISKIDLRAIPAQPDIAISCLSLHHLKYRDKIRLINHISSSGIKNILIVEVDHSLETIKDIHLRNISATLLYRDVFDTIRVFSDHRSNDILDNFYYDEYATIIKSCCKDLEEKYLNLSEWAAMIIGAGMRINDMRITFSGINNIYRIGIIDGVK